MPLAALASVAGNVIGGIMGNRAQDKDRAMQKEFAQHGIRWKVEDAKAAGLHPLAALGAQSTSYAPVSVGGSPMGNALAQSGQDVSRAINATRTSPERIDAYTKTVQDLNLQRMGLENQLLGSQIAKINQAGTPPPMPTSTDPYLIEGQTQSGVKGMPLKRVNPNPGTPYMEPGSIVDLGYSRTPGGYAPVMSHDVKQRLEEDLIGMLTWNIRNRLGPTLGFNNTPPNVPLGAGESWFYHPGMQEYRAVKNRGSISRGFPGRHYR